MILIYDTSNARLEVTGDGGNVAANVGIIRKQRGTEDSSKDTFKSWFTHVCDKIENKQIGLSHDTQAFQTIHRIFDASTEIKLTINSS